MSQPTLDTFNCKGCGWQQAFTVCESLNVTLDPEKRHDLLSGDLTRFTCEKCAWSTEVVYALLYHDMKKRIMIWLVPPGDGLSADQFCLIKLTKDYRFRRVTTRNHLVEKMLIAGSDLDDRVVECFKLVIQYGLATNNELVPQELFFLDVTESDTGEKIIVFEFLSEEGQQCFEFPFQTFKDVEALVTPKLPSADADTGQWLQVDAEYAKPLLNSARRIIRVHRS
jgi:hypothetical protein